MDLYLPPVKMTPDVMRRLQAMNPIRLLSPRCGTADCEAGTTKVERLYTGEPGFGRHCLISVTVAVSTFSQFGAHSDNEDILFIGREDCRPLYLAIALRGRAVLEEKAHAGLLTADDFVCLEVAFNRPDASFFVMNKHVFHGECVAAAATEGWPSFYVTEPSELDLVKPDLGPFALCVRTAQVCMEKCHDRFL